MSELDKYTTATLHYIDSEEREHTQPVDELVDTGTLLDPYTDEEMQISHVTTTINVDHLKSIKVIDIDPKAVIGIVSAISGRAISMRGFYEHKNSDIVSLFTEFGVLTMHKNSTVTVVTR